MDLLKDYKADLISESKTDLIAEMQQPTKPGIVKKAAGYVADQAISTVETIASLAASAVLWPISKAWGVSNLLTGSSASYAKEQEEKVANFAYQPRNKYAKGAMGHVAKVMDVVTWPARIAGEGATDMWGAKAGYLTELAGELGTFYMLGKGGGKAKATLEAKLQGLKPEEFQMVKEMSKTVRPKRKPRKEPLDESYERVKDRWLGNRDVEGKLYPEVEARLLQKDIIKAAGSKKLGRRYDQAIQLHIDLKKAPQDIGKYYDKLTPEKQKIIDLSQNLPPKIKEIADLIEAKYRDMGTEGLEAGVIRNMLDHYASRTWTKKQSTKFSAKFGTKTHHAKNRKFDTILDGWEAGFELHTKEATSNLGRYKKDISRTIADRDFVNELVKAKTIDGEPLLTSQQHKGYARVNHPNFKKWEHAGKMEDGKVYGQNFFADKNGNLFERKEMYAPKQYAKDINNMLGHSALNEIPTIPTISKYNSLIKGWILQSSLFHPQAFLRSYEFGTNHKTLNEARPIDSYKSGLKMIDQLDPVIVNGVRNGLTLGVKQDWQPQYFNQKTVIGKVLDKTKATRVTKDKINSLRQMQADWLFGTLGAGYKAKAYAVELRNQLKKYPHENPDALAKRVATLINDDFGGLHLQRLGRNPTLQHLFQLTALAPDWTESNIRTMVKTIKNKSGSKAELAMYRRFWAGIVVKGLGLTAAANYVLSGGDLGEMIDKYKKAWESGNMNWSKVDITPIYHAIGSNTKESKYFSVLGHFQDPAKAVTNPVRFGKHKGSVAAKVVLEALTGTDWKGQQYTTLEELIGEGKTVKWGKGHPITYEQLPAFILSQGIGMQPVQVQNLVSWANGEIDGIDAILRGSGFHLTSTYSQKNKGLNKLKGLQGATK